MLVALAWWSSAHAATLSVAADGSTPYQTIQDALADAEDGDLIEVGPGTWAGGIYVQGRQVTIRSTDGADATVLVADGEPVVQAWGVLTLEGFTIQGSGYRGVEILGGEGNLYGIVFEDITSPYYGGALYVSNAEVSLSSSTVDGGVSAGGTIMATNAVLSMTDVSVSGAAADVAAGLYAYQSTIRMEQVSFVQNYATSGGAGIYLDESSLVASEVTLYANVLDYGSGAGLYAAGSTIELIGGRFEQNYSPNYTNGYFGGGIAISSSVLSAQGTVFVDNIAYYGGAVWGVDSQVTFQDVELDGNYAYYGGAVYLQGGSTLEDSGSQWLDNAANNDGGALFAYNGYAVSVSDSAFVGNVSTYGYGGAIMGNSSGQLTLINTTFDDNYAYNNGGAVVSYYAYSEDFYQGCVFTNNTISYSGGGAIAQYGYSNAVIVDSTFTGNSSDYAAGGAVYGYYSGLDIQGSTFINNSAVTSNGGAVYSQYAAGNGAELKIQGSSFVSNGAQYYGGAVASFYNAVIIEDSTFTANDTDSNGMGGAVFSSHSGPYQYTGTPGVRRNLFSGNNAGYGGAFYSEYAAGSVGAERWSNNIFQENTARIGGAGVWVSAVSPLVDNNTFVGNSANQTAGSIALVESPITFTNNLIAFSSAGAAIHGYDDASAAAVLSFNSFHEVSDGIASGTISEAALLDHDAALVDPALSAYTLDGDPSNDVLVLLRDSALIDAGDPSRVDVDGSRSDIGAWGGDGIVVADADQDGTSNWMDCDDSDAAAHPGAAEVYYDGKNQDCLSGSDFDADSDGADSADHGGTDCDDSDAAVQVDCPELAEPDSQAPTDEGGNQGCAHAGARGPAGLWLLIVVLAMRRARDASVAA
jgi:predicted outer membrane repeat protein